MSHDDLMVLNSCAFETNSFERVEVHDGDDLGSHDDDDDEVAEDGVYAAVLHDDDALDGHGCDDFAFRDERVESGVDEVAEGGVYGVASKVAHGSDHDALYAHDDEVEEGSVNGVYETAPCDAEVVDGDGCDVSRDDVAEESGK